MGKTDRKAEKERHSRQGVTVLVSERRNITGERRRGRERERQRDGQAFMKPLSSNITEIRDKTRQDSQEETDRGRINIYICI